MMDVRVLHATEELRELQSAWNELHAISPKQEICNSWAWLYGWWTVYGQRDWKLEVCCLYEDAKLVAIAPYYIDRSVAGNCLRLMGKGEPEEQEICSEFVDILIDPSCQQKAIELLASHHRSYFCNVTRIELLQVLEHSSASEIWKTAGFNLRHIKRGIRYELALEKDLRSTLKRLPSTNLRKKATRLLNQLQNERFTVEVVTCPDDFERCWSILQRLHEKRWHEKGKDGAFKSRHFYEFHRWLFAELAPSGQAKMIFVYTDAPLAAIYCFCQNSRVYYYQSGIDTDSGGSPGILSHLAALNHVVGGFDRYDFMLGGTQSYKASWATELTEVKDIIGYSQTLRGLLQKLKDDISGTVRRSRIVNLIRKR